MTQTLFALCQQSDGGLTVKRVGVAQDVQDQLGTLFEAQAAAFFDGVIEQIEFNGSWKPDRDELLYIEAPPEASILSEAVLGNALSVELIDAKSFASESIRALFVAVQGQVGLQILIQRFTAQQTLARKFALLLDGNSFKQLTEPLFTLDTQLSAVMESGKLKFKSFFTLKRIFPLKEFYEVASNQQIGDFCNHPAISADADLFARASNEKIRKLVHSVLKAKVLERNTPEEIAEVALGVSLRVHIEGGRIVMPDSAREIYELLRFLDDGIYAAPLSKTEYITNSKRPFRS